MLYYTGLNWLCLTYFHSMLQSHIYKLALQSKLRKDIHLSLSSKILPTIQQDKSTWDHSPYGEIFVSIKYGFPGFLELRWESLHLVLSLTFSLDFGGSFISSSFPWIYCWGCLRGLNLLIFKATEKKSFESDKNKLCLWMWKMQLIKSYHAPVSRCFLYIWGLSPHYKKQFHVIFPTRLKTTNVF